MGPTVPFWAVEVGDAAVNAVRVRRAPDNALEVLACWSSPLGPGDDPVATAVALLRRRGLRDHGIQLVLPGRGATCRSCRISPEDNDMSSAELERELFDLTAHEPEDALLRHRRLGSPEVLDFRVVAERRDELGRWEKAFEEAGFRHLGVSVAPGALLTALEALRLGPARGYAFEMRGRWSALTAFEGALTVRHPIPFGHFDIARRLEEAGAGFTLDQALDAVPGSPAAAALAAAAAPLAEDFHRAVDFHRTAVRGTGDESLLLLGAGTDRPGLRAVLGQISPVALAAASDPAALPGLRLGPRVRLEDFRRGLPLWTVPLGAAMAASGLAPRDLEFRLLPDDLPAPREGSLYPVAAAALALAVAASWLLAVRTRDALARGREAVASIPAPPAVQGPLTAAEGREQGLALSRLVREARERAALRRALSSLVAAFPRAESPSHGVEGLEVRGEGGNFRATARFRVPSGGDGASDLRSRTEDLARALQDAGWRVTLTRDGLVTAERLEMAREGPR